ncbi:MAG TPA: transcriptional repressor [Anaeromyxobacter sp.]|nr:transcriptional repressor [Anaeromyxobacter sp.]
MSRGKLALRLTPFQALLRSIEVGATTQERLRRSGIQPSAQRVAVADYVLATDAHPTAEQVWSTVRARFPELSRATVYNTLNLLVRKGLLRQVQLEEGRTGFDPNLAPHHHFIDEATGHVHDVPWDALEVRRVEALRGLEVREYQVVLRGRRARAKSGGAGSTSA